MEAVCYQKGWYPPNWCHKIENQIMGPHFPQNPVSFGPFFMTNVFALLVKSLHSAAVACQMKSMGYEAEWTGGLLPSSLVAWRWRQQVSLQSLCLSTDTHCVIPTKTEICSSTALWTWDLPSLIISGIMQYHVVVKASLHDVMNISPYWYVQLCQRFERNFCLHLQVISGCIIKK